ncbi:MAG: hypothetical protein M3203_13975 [Actinomycetota bacterium]|nr:hypothetical protein [Actinomycetota bacterium]
MSSGMRFDVDALTDSPAALARVPLVLLALLLAVVAPALRYRRSLRSRRATVAALVQATSLPCIVATTHIAVPIGAIHGVTAASLVSAGLLWVVIFPPIALARLRAFTTTVPDPDESPPPLPLLAHRPMGTQD